MEMTRLDHKLLRLLANADGISQTILMAHCRDDDQFVDVMTELEARGAVRRRMVHYVIPRGLTLMWFYLTPAGHAELERYA
jgi:hypothetical protein